jgi:hypothetical protein
VNNESPLLKLKIMTQLHEIAGTYILKSPYHKNKKLPFNIESDGYVSTVEYKGWQAYLVQCKYSLESLLQLIEKKIIIPGQVNFPRSIKKN